MNRTIEEPPSDNLFAPAVTVLGEVMCSYAASSAEPVPCLEFTLADFWAIYEELRTDKDRQEAQLCLMNMGVEQLPNILLYGREIIWLLYAQDAYAGERSAALRPVDDIYLATTKEGQIAGVIARSSLWPAATYGVARARTALMEDPSKLVQVGGVQSCFRREALEDIKAGWRQVGFNQADIEVAALIDDEQTAQQIDAATVTTAISFLEGLGFSLANLQLRINSPAKILFSVLQKEGISFDEGVVVLGWKYLNEMAAARARGQPSDAAKSDALRLVGFWKQNGRLTEQAFQLLGNLIRTGAYDANLMERDYPEEYQSLRELNDLANILAGVYPQMKIVIDPLSTRSGYDSTTYQFDVQTDNGMLAEIGGGGAYTRLARSSWAMQFGETAPGNFYMAGVAFGLLRLTTAAGVLRRQEAEQR